MIRPPRSRKRFRGKIEGTDGQTHLSGPQGGEEADGRGMRRRMAFGIGACLLILALVLVFTVNPDKDTKEIEEVGDATSIESYLMKSTATLESIGAKVQIMEHVKSGLQVMTLVPDDHEQDYTFGISFRTLPENTRGTAHVVEHAVMAGSDKYPIKDPFNQLQRGSLQTFSDTWTSKDRTGFVLASRNRQDFKNGMDVMLDGIFHPLMVHADHAWVFRQEAWRLELVDNSWMYLSGNALNEAKAAQMHPNQSMLNYLYKKLFPDTTYSIDSRGEVVDIVSMTHKEIVDYYHKYYKPANGQAFCYGSQAVVNDCMDMLSDVLDAFPKDEHVRESTKVSWQNLNAINADVEKVAYPSYQDTTDFRMAQSWVLNDQPMDSRTEVAWFLLEELLIGNVDSSLYRTVVELDLGDDVIGGLESSLQQWTFMVGVSGVKSDADIQTARNAFSETLLQVAQSGFSDQQVKAAFNRMDFRLNDLSTSEMPLGVRTFHSVINKWTYDQDPKIPLLYAKAFNSLRDEITNNGQTLLLDMITKFLIDNRHTVTVALYPSTTLADEFRQMEQDWIDGLDQIVDKEQGLQMLRETDQLHKIQEMDDSEEALAKLPRLAVSDLNATMWELPLKVDNDIFDSGLTLLEHTVPNSNGIVYVDFIVDMSNIDFDDMVLLPLFTHMLIRSGTDRKTDTEFRREIDIFTGGIGVYPLIDEILQTDGEGGYIVPDGKHLISKIIVRTSCHVSTGGLVMFNLIKQVLFDAKVNDEATIIEVLEKMIDDMEDDIQTRGYYYTTMRINSRYSLPGYFAEQWQGVTQLFNLRRALAQARADFSALGDRLVLMHDVLKRGNRNGMVLSVTGDHDSIKAVSAAVEIFVKDTLPPAAQVSKFPDFGAVEHPWVPKGLHRMAEELKSTSFDEAFIVPTRVNHVAKGGVLYDVGERVTGSDMVALHYLSGYYLYERLHFNLGALGAWATLDFDSGSVVYQSNQDPNIKETVDIYEGGAGWLYRQISGRDTLPPEALASIIGTIGGIDGSAFHPSEVGYYSTIQYLRQDKPEYRQKWRDEILAASPESLLKMVERLGAWIKDSVVVVTNQRKLDEALAQGFNFTVCHYTGQGCYVS